jgi:hypothetical protein
MKKKHVPTSELAMAIISKKQGEGRNDAIWLLKTTDPIFSYSEYFSKNGGFYLFWNLLSFTIINTSSKFFKIKETKFLTFYKDE